MPNIYVSGLDREQTRRFSRLVSDFFARELGTSRENVYVFRREVELFRDGREASLPTIVEVSWIRRPPEHFEKAVQAITRIVRDELGSGRPVQVELREKWHDAAVDGELCSAWAARNRTFPSS